MKTLLTAFILIVGLSLASAQHNVPQPKKLDLKGMITVHIKSAPESGNIPVSLNTYHSFPKSDVDHFQDSLTDNNELYMHSPFRATGKIYVSIADSTYELVGAPGDTISILVLNNLQSVQQKRLVVFEGKNKEIQQYYQAKTRVMDDPIQACMNEGMSAKSLAPFKKMMDATYQQYDQFWTNYQKNHILPDWFKTYESNELNYSDAWLRVYMVWYQIEYQKKKQVIPDSYYDFKKRIMIKNEAAMYDYQYLRFLREEMFSQLRQSKQEISLGGFTEFVHKKLGEKLGPFVEIWELSGSVDNPNWVETKFNRPFPAQYQYLVDYIKLRAKDNIKVLKSGDKAPNFALVDSNDSLISLSQFKGQVVYLSFWFTTCGACVKEIPFENKLVEQFKNRPVKIISICTGTPGAADEQQLPKWKATSKRFNLKTIDLFSNFSWTSTLREKYLISAYPHYVLIGADGKVIENFAERPSQNIAAKIEKAIANAGK
ncbi:Thiol-disulfide oxidoreductase ResA [Dyadobacter sp. CECT 9623]|uniref:Thiol-disulfide oxidoreductase ResA n=1 Tax=Dyadobacter linearis TaxID=2823330 RepID=A0ABM8UL19_9BACT|nr:TlpA disulfide reductase family protein [Dyadobacter sp. CECT 9623]CAG5068191.1 Thiol-disulfide oxidoreductase ResA [Dyadobacter sp. CECT 9623]